MVIGDLVASVRSPAPRPNSKFVLIVGGFYYKMSSARGMGPLPSGVCYIGSPLEIVAKKGRPSRYQSGNYR